VKTVSVRSSAFGLSHCDLITANKTFVGFSWNFVKEYFKRIAKQVWIPWQWPREKCSTLTSYTARAIWLQFGIAEFHVILLRSCEIRQKIFVTSIPYLQVWVNFCSIFYIFRSIWIKLLICILHKNSISRCIWVSLKWV